MTRKEVALALMTMLTLQFSSANASPMPALNLPMLTNEASLIVVGAVTGVREEGRTSIDIQGQSVPARQMAGTLRVDRVLKGRLSASTVVVGFLMPDVSLGYKGIAARDFGMFFLREASPQRYVVLNPYYPFIVASPDAPVTEGDALSRVIAEVAHTLVSRNVSIENRREAIEILDRVATLTATEALKRAAQTLDMPLRLRAAAALLRRNDLSTIG